MTYTGQALKLTRTDVLTTANGARKDSKKYAVLVTDGEASDDVTAANETKNYRKKVHRIFQKKYQ